MSRKFLSFLFLSFVTLVSSNCGPSSPVPPGSGLEVVELPERVLRITMNPFTFQPVETFLDDGVVGTRRLRIAVDWGTDGQFIEGGVQVNSWVPPQDTIPHGMGEITEPAKKVDGGTTEFIYDLPRSGELGICSRMHYRWVITYKNTRLNNNGLYMGAEKYVMPTKTINSPNSISQVTCEAP